MRIAITRLRRMIILTGGLFLAGCGGNDGESSDAKPQVDPAKREEWTEDVGSSLAEGNAEAAEEALFSLRDHFGTEAALNAIDKAGFYTASEHNQRWVIRQLADLAEGQGEEAALRTADAALRFARSPVPRLRSSALNELRKLAVDHAAVVSHSTESLLDLFDRGDIETQEDVIHTFGRLAGVKSVEYSDLSGREHPLRSTRVPEIVLETFFYPELRREACLTWAQLAQHDLRTGAELISKIQAVLESQSTEEIKVGLQVLREIAQRVDLTRGRLESKEDLPPEALDRLKHFRAALEAIKPQIQALTETSDRSLRSEAENTQRQIDSILSRPISR